jgi:hypothetical protein
MKHLVSIASLLTVLWVIPAQADSTDAACVIYPAGSDHAEATIPCTFGQRQGYITITRSDGVSHDLAPAGETVGNFLDQKGRTVFRQSGLGDQGFIFRLPDETVYVYWNTDILNPSTGNNDPTSPFTTADYDATTLLRCRASGKPEFATCPAGILRMEGGEASIVVQNQKGEQFTINFMKDYVNATNRELKAKREGDTWILDFTNGEIWEVPVAAIEGG